GGGGDGGDDLPAVGQGEAHRERAVGPELDGLALQSDAGVRLGGAVDDQFGVELEPEVPQFAAGHQPAGAEAGDRRRAQRSAQALLEELLQLQAAGGRVEPAGHGVDAVGLLGVDVGPVLVEDVADAGPVIVGGGVGAGPGGGEGVGAGRAVDAPAAGKGADVQAEGAGRVADVDVPVVTTAVDVDVADNALGGAGRLLAADVEQAED